MEKIGGFESKEEKEFRHKLIQNEFRDALTKKDYEAPVDTDGVVVLSAKEYNAIQGETIDYSLDENLENKVRMESGIEVIRKVVANKINKPVGEVGNEDLVLYSPKLILSGTTEQLPFMRQTAIDLNFPLERVELVDCGKAGAGNTKTQFETVNEYYKGKDPKHVVFITTSFHAPRVSRTGNVNLDKEIPFDVIAVPYAKYKYNVFNTVRGEVYRIANYSEKCEIIVKNTALSEAVFF